MSSDLLSAPPEFLRLFKAGKDAARQGDHATAHDLFRQAIEIDPYHEQVWLWLASVIESEEDQRVCFENVLELNPTNPTARHQLDKLDQQATHQAVAGKTKKTRRTRRRRRMVRLLFLLVVAAAMAAALVAFGVI